MIDFDTHLVQAHQRDLRHDAQAAARARRVRTARRRNRQATRALDRARTAESLLW